MNKKTVYDIDVSGKTVFLRVDYNVPQDKNGHILEDRRIRTTVPTIRYLQEHGAAIVIGAHLGRPKGEIKPELSLKPCAERLGELLGQKVIFAPDCIGEAVSYTHLTLPTTERV